MEQCTGHAEQENQLPEFFRPEDDSNKIVFETLEADPQPSILEQTMRKPGLKATGELNSLVRIAHFKSVHRSTER